MAAIETLNQEAPRSLASGRRLIEGPKLGIEQNADFYIAVQRARFGFRCPFQDKTIDYAVPISWANSQHLFGRFALIGWMVQEHAIGLSNMKDRTKNPVQNVVVNLGAIRAFTCSMAIETINIDWDIEAALIPAVMSGNMSDVVPTEVTVS